MERNQKLSQKHNAVFIGNGAMSCAMANCLSKNFSSICIWGNNEINVKECQSKHENNLYLPGIKLSENITFTSNLDLLTNNKISIIFCGVPTQYIRKTLSKLNKPKANSIIISFAKGLEIGTLNRPSQIIQDVWPDACVMALSGPAQAEELAKGKPFSIVLASNHEKEAKKIQELINTKTMRTYLSNDLIGVEIAGALKNVISITAGINDGLQYGDNAKASIMTRGLAEISRLGEKLGGHKETFSGLAGIGDLITSCISPFGRNYSLGKLLGEGQNYEDIMKNTIKVCEGAFTVKVLHEYSKELNVELPISNEVYSVLYENKSPQEGVQSLMKRTLKSEF
ncbi:MAG: glycerol-3-phosphate dehydrogenase [Planctomycetota bacterium]|nr:MAG: glycerol-3-phosphate dehydrogenase [Planctomycetota bacterium]